MAFQDGPQLIGLGVEADHTEQAHIAAEGSGIHGNVGRARPPHEQPSPA